MSRAALVVFVRAPRLGRVKTRLAAAIGAPAALAVHRALAERVLERTRPQRDEWSRFVFFAPARERGRMAHWLPGEALVPQRGSDLGERMEAAFARLFARGFERVALVGSDVPGLTRALLHHAFASLERHDVALGPAADGGYWLIALERPRPALFRGVAWSTPGVLAATLARARRARLRVALLPALHDVDRAADLRRWPGLRRLAAPTARRARRGAS